MLHDVFGAGAVDLLAAGKSEIDIVFRLIALRYQRIGGEKNAVEGDLGIQRAPSPQNAIFNDAGKGRLIPMGLVGGDYIVVGHHHCRRGGLLTGPAKQQRPVRQSVELAGFKYLGIQFRQQGDELFKFGIIFFLRVGAGNGFALNQLLKISDGGFPVE